MVVRRRKAKPRKRRDRPSATPSPRAVEAALAGIAHDIRTPLTGILALAELLTSSDLPPREREWAEGIKSGAEHLSALATLIVDAAKAAAVGLVLHDDPFSPRALAEAVARSLTARAGAKAIAIDTDIANDMPEFVTGDAMRLRAALENLADNAVKFTQEGRIGFTAEATPADAGRLRLVFTIADSGIGIAPRDLKQLFQPFAQANEDIARRYGGAGLGLAFVKRIATAMGGDVTATSRPAQGATFRLTVTVGAVTARPESADKASTQGPARALSILCAEDNPYGRVVLNTILRELGHRIDFAETGAAAVAAAARGGYDAVLMDVTLPDVDGFTAARRIRALPAPAGVVPIIGVSGRDEPGSAQSARAAGMDFYFTKPLNPGKLAQALAALPAGSR